MRCERTHCLDMTFGERERAGQVAVGSGERVYRKVELRLAASAGERCAAVTEVVAPTEAFTFAARRRNTFRVDDSARSC